MINFRKSKIFKDSAHETPLFWPATVSGGVMWVLDETRVPFKLEYIKVTNARQAISVIRQMKTRAFGQFLVVLNTFLIETKDNRGDSHRHVLNKVMKIATALNRSRPTFPFSEVTSLVVRWAYIAFEKKMDVAQFVQKNILAYLSEIRKRRLQRVEDLANTLKSGDSVLTHCNVSGELAMAAYICRQKGKDVQYFATETRPYFQGAKLTCWELQLMGADVTLIADNAVGTVMADGLVNKIVVGSDRNCANGDFANKVGTYQIAVLAKEFGIPMYVLTQPSKKIKKGKDIPIEIRQDSELLTFGGRRVYPSGVKGLYPGFDVVPNKYITKSIEINVN